MWLIFKHPSSAKHVKFGANLGGPPSKAKYVPVTDSKAVPWGKGEKYPAKGSEIVPETIRLQAVGAVLHCDGVPFVEWASELRCVARLRKIEP